MAQDELPQTYLITPTDFDHAEFCDELAQVLDAHPVACVRLALSTRDETRILKTGDALRDVCHARDVALVIENHILMVERLGLDGVHMSDGARNVRKTRKELGDDAIIGAFCSASRHDGMIAGDASADYVSFGPLSGATLGDGTLAEADLFSWWSEMIEVPIVAEGGLTSDIVRQISPVTDFLAFGDEIWGTGQPAATLETLLQARV